MKTKLFYLIAFILIGGKNLAQSNTNAFVGRIDHFDQFVQHLQNRQPNTATIRLDSITGKNYDAANSVYTLNSLQTFSFDNNNMNIEDAFNTWNNNSSSLLQQNKSEYTYTNSGMIAEIINYYYNFNANALVPSQKNLYTYNASGQLSEMVIQQYDTPSSQFVNQQKEVYTYAQTSDPKPNLVQIYQWDTANTSWADFQRGTIAYNSNFQFTDIIMENKDVSNNTWVNNQHFVRIYDTNMRLLENSIQTWQTNAWVNYNKKTISYTPMGNYEEVIEENFSWDAPNSSWKVNSKQEMHIDNNDNVLQRAYFYWDAVNNQLVGSTKSINTYNANILEVTYFSWDNQTQDWATDTTQKELYTYDMSVAKTDLILPYLYVSSSSFSNSLFSTGLPNFDDLNHKLLTKESFYRTTASDPWILSYKQIYLYTDTTAAIDNYRQITAKVYPNPFKDTIRFEVASDTYSIHIYALDGRLLYRNLQQTNVAIDVSFLTKGIYVYHIDTANGRASGQIIKH